MAEKITPVEMVEIDYICDKCGEGEMRPSRFMLASDPPRCPHACTKCGHEQTFLTKYPATGYRRKEA